MDLTNEQIQAIHCGEPVAIAPPELGEECVVLRRDIYEQLKSASNAGDFDPARYYPLAGELMAEDDAIDPSLESYQKYKR